MYGRIIPNVERLISNNLEMRVLSCALTISSKNSSPRDCATLFHQTKISEIIGECTVDISKTPVWLASLIALIIMATGFNALGAQSSVGAVNDDWWTGYPDQVTGEGWIKNYVDDALSQYDENSADWSP